MNAYKILSQNVFAAGEYSIVPIRMEDRHAIRKWRNEQIYHLRQSKPLSEADQDHYFETVVAHLFEKEKPEQLLFSFLEGDSCIGYGGIVHIDWRDRNGEISFLIDSERNTEKHYLKLFEIFLDLLTQAAIEAGLFKIYTYGYDIADYRFIPLERTGFSLEAVLKEHVLVEGRLCDVRMYGKLLEE